MSEMREPAPTERGPRARSSRDDRDPSVPRTTPVTACPVCGEEGREELWTRRDRLHPVPGVYRYVRCSRCASVYQSPRVVADDLHLCYPEAYYTHGGSGSSPETGEAPARSVRDRIRGWVRGAVQWGGEEPSEPVGRLLGSLLARIKIVRERAFFGLWDPVIPRSPEPGRALEVGPGSGWELGLLDRVGWEAEGVDFDPRAAEEANRSGGPRVRVGDFLEVVSPDERFDLIYLSHVLEHLPDTRRAFRFFHRHLSRRGRAVLVYPNPEGLGARVWGRDWVHWDPPRHLVLPSIRGARHLAGETGLRATVKTRARSAAYTRQATKRPGRPNGQTRDRNMLDLLFGLGEGLLAGAGFALGEEVIVVLEKEGEA